jgi:hypothetical protein
VYGSKVQASSLCKPSDQASNALMISFLFYNYGAIVGFVQFEDCVDWKARMVGCGVVSRIASMDIVLFKEMGSTGHLVEVNNDKVICGKPSKVCPKEPFNCLHKINGDKLGNKGFKFPFNRRVFGKKTKSST